MNQIKLNESKVALIDEIDYARLTAKGKWHYADGEAVQHSLLPSGKWQLVKMRNCILKPREGYDVYHRNGDKLDNRHKNLCYRKRLPSNGGLRPDSRSGLYGVHFDTRRQLWAAKINAAGEFIYLGYFDSDTEAAAAYDQAAIHHFGDGAQLNNL